MGGHASSIAVEGYLEGIDSKRGSDDHVSGDDLALCFPIAGTDANRCAWDGHQGGTGDAALLPKGETRGATLWFSNTFPGLGQLPGGTTPTAVRDETIGTSAGRRGMTMTHEKHEQQQGSCDGNQP
jgi:hypothetical protein